MLGGFRFTAISAGAEHTCALTLAGDAYCWGAGDDGRLGTGNSLDRDTPAAVVGGLTFVRISAGARHTCGVTTSGEVYCWGFGGDGRLGTGNPLDRMEPALVQGGLIRVILKRFREVRPWCRAGWRSWT